MTQVLDHGYITLVDKWGSDQSVVEAARMSTDKAFRGWGTEAAPGDEKLLRYLWKHKHTSPFELAGVSIEVQAPIFVFREWHRHRTQSFSELSARYASIPDLNYEPGLDRLLMNSDGKNKQAGTIKEAENLTSNTAVEYQDRLQYLYYEAQSLYEWALKAGVPKELARVHLPVGRYSRMRASANLLNWLKFVTLRSDEGAQWEIRQYSNALVDILASEFPRIMDIFNEG